MKQLFVKYKQNISRPKKLFKGKQLEKTLMSLKGSNSDTIDTLMIILDALKALIYVGVVLHVPLSDHQIVSM